MSKITKLTLMAGTALTAVSAVAQIPAYEVTAVLPERAIVKDFNDKGTAAVGNIDSSYNGLPFYWGWGQGIVMLNPIFANQSNAVGITNDGVIYGNFSNSTSNGAWSAGFRWDSPLAVPTILPTAGPHTYAAILDVTNNYFLNILKNIGAQAAPSEIQDAFTLTPQPLPSGIQVIDHMSSDGIFAVGRGTAGVPTYRFRPGETIATTYADPFEQGFNVKAINNSGAAAGFVRNTSQSLFDLPARWDANQNVQVLGVAPEYRSAHVRGLTDSNLVYGFGVRTDNTSEAVIWMDDNQVVPLKRCIKWSTREQIKNWIPTSVTAANMDGSVLAVTVTDTRGTAAWQDDKRFSVILGQNGKAHRLMP